MPGGIVLAGGSGSSASKGAGSGSACERMARSTLFCLSFHLLNNKNAIILNVEVNRKKATQNLLWLTVN